MSEVTEKKERNHEIVEGFRAGVSVNKLASRFGLSMYNICHILGPQTLEMLPPSTNKRQTDDVIYLSGINDAYQEKHMNDLMY